MIATAGTCVQVIGAMEVWSCSRDHNDVNWFPQRPAPGWRINIRHQQLLMNHCSQRCGPFKSDLHTQYDCVQIPAVTIHRFIDAAYQNAPVIYAT